jgi:hypothetical protein
MLSLSFLHINHMDFDGVSTKGETHSFMLKVEAALSSEMSVSYHIST